jgi:hypothetical protein
MALESELELAESSSSEAPLFIILGGDKGMAENILLEERKLLRQNLRWLLGPFRLFEYHFEHLGHSQSVGRT